MSGEIDPISFKLQSATKGRQSKLSATKGRQQAGQPAGDKAKAARLAAGAYVADTRPKKLTFAMTTTAASATSRKVKSAAGLSLALS